MKDHTLNGSKISGKQRAVGKASCGLLQFGDAPLQFKSLLHFFCFLYSLQKKMELVHQRRTSDWTCLYRHGLLHPFAPDSISWVKYYHSGREVSRVAKETSQNRNEMEWTGIWMDTCSPCASSEAYLGIKPNTLHLKKLLHRAFLLQSSQRLGGMLLFSESDYGPGSSLLNCI